MEVWGEAVRLAAACTLKGRLIGVCDGGAPGIITTKRQHRERHISVFGGWVYDEMGGEKFHAGVLGGEG